MIHKLFHPRSLDIDYHWGEIRTCKITDDDKNNLIEYMKEGIYQKLFLSKIPKFPVVIATIDSDDGDLFKTNFTPILNDIEKN